MDNINTITCRIQSCFSMNTSFTYNSFLVKMANITPDIVGKIEKKHIIWWVLLKYHPIMLIFIQYDCTNAVLCFMFLSLLISILFGMVACTTTSSSTTNNNNSNKQTVTNNSTRWAPNQLQPLVYN